MDFPAALSRLQALARRPYSSLNDDEKTSRFWIYHDLSSSAAFALRDPTTQFQDVLGLIVLINDHAVIFPRLNILFYYY